MSLLTRRVGVACAPREGPLSVAAHPIEQHVGVGEAEPAGPIATTNSR
jgi:hypothetical protein